MPTIAKTNHRRCAPALLGFGEIPISLDDRRHGRAAAKLFARRFATGVGSSGDRSNACLCRPNIHWRKPTGRWSWPNQIRGSPASSAGSICDRRVWRNKSNAMPTTPNSSACGTLFTTSRTNGGCCVTMSFADCKCWRSTICPTILLLRPPHLKHIPELSRRVPGLKMVVDHLAKPLIRARELEPWRTDLAAVAKIPGMHCKISGMVNEADMARWRATDFAPFVDVALELFGPSRLMFGSDWPVCRLAGEYSEVLAAAQSTLASLSADERAGVFGGNAIRFYGLST